MVERNISSLASELGRGSGAILVEEIFVKPVIIVSLDFIFNPQLISVSQRSF